MRPKIQFVFVIGPKVGPTSRAKNPKKGVVRRLAQQDFIWRFMMEKRGRHAVNEVSGSLECFGPKFLSHVRMR